MSDALVQTKDHVDKSILDRDLIDQLVTIVSMGNYYTAACAALMINYYTFQRWMRVGKVDVNNGRDTLYAELYNRIRQADAMAEIFTVNTWRKSMNLYGDGIDSDRQSASSINVPPLIEGDLLTLITKEDSSHDYEAR